MLAVLGAGRAARVVVAHRDAVVVERGAGADRGAVAGRAWENVGLAESPISAKKSSCLGLGGGVFLRLASFCTRVGTAPSDGVSLLLGGEGFDSLEVVRCISLVFCNGGVLGLMKS